MHHPNLLTNAVRTARPIFFYTIFFSFIINLLFLAVPLYSLQVLDRVMSTGSMETLFWLSVIIVMSFIATGCLQALRSFVLIRASHWLGEKLSQPLLASSLFHAAGTGTRGTQNIKDLNNIKRFVTGNTLVTLFDAPWALIYLLILFIVHAELGCIALLGCVVMVTLAWLNELAMRQPLEEASDIDAKNLQQLDIAMRNAETIEAMGMAGAVIRHWYLGNQKATSLHDCANYRSAVMQALTKFIRLVLQLAVIGWGADLALHNEITSGSIIAASILMGRALAPFDASISTWKSLIETRKAYTRLHDALECMAMRQSGISLPVPQGRLAVHTLTYGISGRIVPILKDIHFELEPGEVLGIAGPSATGKSTLARLCVGICRPNTGAVRLDGADVLHWRREEFGQHVGYLPQDIEFFSGSVRDNIARMMLDTSDTAVVKAAQLAGAHELILGLPQGYDTDIGRRAALSAGQRQRIALARAFFGEPKLIVLDEPDANLDADGERGLAHALTSAKAARITMLIVTHRRTLLHHMDKLLVLNAGKMMVFGPTQKVIAALNSGIQTETGSMRLEEKAYAA